MTPAHELWRLQGLGWLVSPTDVRGQCRSLRDGGADQHGLGERLRALASMRLDNTQLDHVARTITTLRLAGANLAPLLPVRLGLISNATTSLIVPALVASAARHGVLLEVIETDFDQAIQEALSPHSKLSAAKPDVVLAALDHRGVPLVASPGDEGAGTACIQAILAHLQTIRDGISRNCGAAVIFQTLAAPVETLFGSLDRTLPGTERWIIDGVNARLGSLAVDGSLILDVAGLAEAVGTGQWLDPVHWNVSKLPFAPAFIPIYAEFVGRLLGALRGTNRKCLVLDLDNTVWGGVIGDDGLTGIKLGNGSAVGEAHLAVQRLALALRARGVILAVSSKNDDHIALEPFRHHPDMILKESHISVFQANWNDKAANLRAIAQTLNIGIDALVLLDDNPVERNQVRHELPMVAVPELPDDPAHYARVLCMAGYFEAVGFSAEDRMRAEQYRENAQRVRLEAQSASLEAYLDSLDMQADMRRFDHAGMTRIAQLVSKTNQFNLTTRRHGETRLAEFSADAKAWTLQVRLRDRFGDNGMIAVVICVEPTAGVWEIDTWLMSCRVLNRGVEQSILNHIVAQARARNIESIMGRYVPTDRNAMVRDLYARLGFVPAGTEGSDSLWALEAANYNPFEVAIAVTAD